MPALRKGLRKIPFNKYICNENLPNIVSMVRSRFPAERQQSIWMMNNTVILCKKS